MRGSRGSHYLRLVDEGQAPADAVADGGQARRRVATPDEFRVAAALDAAGIDRRKIVGELNRAHNPALVHLAHSVLRNHAEAEDVVQRVWEQLLSRESNGYDPERGSVRKWLTLMVGGAARNRVRRDSRRRKWESPGGTDDLLGITSSAGEGALPVPAPPPSPLESLETESLRRRLTEIATPRLSKPLLQMLPELLYGDGDPDYGAVGRRTGVKESTLRCNFTRLRAKLATLLSIAFGPEEGARMRAMRDPRSEASGDAASTGPADSPPAGDAL